MNAKYKLILENGVTPVPNKYARKDAAVKAGERHGMGYRIKSPSGQIVTDTFVFSTDQDKADGTAIDNPVVDPIDRSQHEAEYTVHYSGVSKAYWGILGVQFGPKVAGPGTNPVVRTRDHSIVISGNSVTTLKDAVKRLHTFWDEANTALVEFKKTPRYRKVGRDTKEGRDQRYSMEKVFLTKFAKSYGA